MRDYLMLLHENPAATATLSPTEMQALLERYMTWGRSMAEQGRMVTGHKLRDEGGRIVRREGGSTRITDGPFIEAKEVVGGLYVIRAADYDEAASLAATCPHADLGWIEVREIETFDE
jgi:hypothetical protein